MKTFLETYKVKEKRRLKETFLENFDDYLKQICLSKKG